MEPGVIESKIEEHERRLVVLEQDTFKEKIYEKMSELKASLARMEGRMAGYLIAGGVLGAGLAMALRHVFGQ